MNIKNVYYSGKVSELDMSESIAPFTELIQEAIIFDGKLFHRDDFTHLVKFGYMVDRRSIIFSKLFDGRALSCTTAIAPPTARLPATRGCSAPTGTAATTGSGAAAKGPPVLALAELVGTGGSGVKMLLSGEGWY